MRDLTITLLCCAALACPSGSLRAQAPSTKARRPSPANGKAVFLRIGCPSCHGTEGQGGAGARLAPNTLPLEAFRAWVRTGTPGWTIARGMPAFPAGVITDTELADMQAFLASLPPPPSPDRIPLLKP